jgi:hypothetical protein
MYVSEQDAAAMYARACSAWYRGRASRVVATKIKHLQKIGDRGGVKAWSRVAAELAEVKRENGRTERQTEALLRRSPPNLSGRPVRFQPPSSFLPADGPRFHDGKRN